MQPHQVRVGRSDGWGIGLGVGGHNKMLARYMGQYGKQKHCSPVETGKKGGGSATKTTCTAKKFLINVANRFLIIFE